MTNDLSETYSVGVSFNIPGIGKLGFTFDVNPSELQSGASIEVGEFGNITIFATHFIRNFGDSALN